MTIQFEQAFPKKSRIFGAMTALPVFLLGVRFLAGIENSSAQEALLGSGFVTSIFALCYGLAKKSDIKMKDGLSNLGILKAATEGFLFSIALLAVLGIVAIFIQCAMKGATSEESKKPVIGISILGFIAVVSLTIAGLLACSDRLGFFAPRRLREHEMRFIQGRHNDFPPVVVGTLPSSELAPFPYGQPLQFGYQPPVLTVPTPQTHTTVNIPPSVTL